MKYIDQKNRGSEDLTVRAKLGCFVTWKIQLFNTLPYHGREVEWWGAKGSNDENYDDDGLFCSNKTRGISRIGSLADWQIFAMLFSNSRISS
jgi:hypothetical protein